MPVRPLWPQRVLQLYSAHKQLQMWMPYWIYRYLCACSSVPTSAVSNWNARFVTHRLCFCSSGQRCDKVFDGCKGRPCRNGGTCAVASNTPHGFICKCPPVSIVMRPRASLVILFFWSVVHWSWPLSISVPVGIHWFFLWIRFSFLWESELQERRYMCVRSPWPTLPVPGNLHWAWVPDTYRQPLHI